MYLIRLDDACEYMNLEKWHHIETILDLYSVKPIVGIIPECRDKEFLEKYERNTRFWELAKHWNRKGWTIAMHGYQHNFNSNCAGINPVNHYSEFAGVTFDEQVYKLKCAHGLFQKHGLNPTVFFAPAHTFDINTLKALEQVTDIRIISDTIASDIYYKNNFYFMPQQTGKLRKLPLKMITGCYHPNSMDSYDFQTLEAFIKNNREHITSLQNLTFIQRKYSIYDAFLKWCYFKRKRIGKRNSP